MKAKPKDSPKLGMLEASEEEQKYFESYPDTIRLTLKEVFARSRQEEKPKEPMVIK